ncbi:flavodoxin family protein [Eggerthellaceae bacterium zg-887]|uniref:flavodoxin family protein n=1 Tax=Xiamenia xianingshaonis TaxID=2682776 RepID=UPI00140BBDE5|nr:flavodoxin family protein [Xiamenia xianingshaonis]NHM15293.1 flavodoxin family protein [Xiamenia xianingshaonis]
MGKKILVVNGSPRKNGNTARMVKAFAEASEAKGNTVVEFNAALSNIGGCHACETCYKSGKPCTYDDDFNTVAPDFLEADAIVFAAPTYWYSFPGQIKNAIDKCYSFAIGQKPIGGKDVALIACCEEKDPAVMDGLSLPFDRIAALLKWNIVGKVLVPGVLREGDVDKTDGCSQAAALAEKF